MTPAETYLHWRDQPNRLADAPLLNAPRVASELEVQAAWFSGRFPRHLLTTEGLPVEIIHHGVWNREPGPDFHHAVVKIGNAPPVSGAIEIDLRRRDWEQHGHATNPAYNSVLLHLFVEPGTDEFFTRDSRHHHIPQARLDLTGLDRNAPFPPLAAPGRCTAPLAALSLAKTAGLLQTAAHFRLTEKSRRWQRLASLHGDDEALWQSLARALGYKENKLPFELLAQRLPLAQLRREPEAAEALLFGCAGFLDAPDLAGFPGDSRLHLRGLWDRWWSRRSEMQRLILPRSAWKFTGARPMNHPQRRLATLAVIAGNWHSIRAAFDSFESDRLMFALGALQHEYWEYHYTLVSKAAARPMALLGESRLLDMLVNLAIPRALGIRPDIWQTLEKQRHPLSNRPLETAAMRLFGQDRERRKLVGNALHQQGLLQIYEDFCLRDLTDCTHCPFPERVKHWNTA